MCVIAFMKITAVTLCESLQRQSLRLCFLVVHALRKSHGLMRGACRLLRLSLLHQDAALSHHCFDEQLVVLGRHQELDRCLCRLRRLLQQVRLPFDSVYRRQAGVHCTFSAYVFRLFEFFNRRLAILNGFLVEVLNVVSPAEFLLILDEVKLGLPHLEKNKHCICGTFQILDLFAHGDCLSCFFFCIFNFLFFEQFVHLQKELLCFFEGCHGSFYEKLMCE
mmetsp:Transcript_157066/g.277334  ORF Transcript_157066/g.277334 Transcript_157066/m.277334 type:complete len:221 (-) Transcript_157066:19-681(-)